MSDYRTTKRCRVCRAQHHTLIHSTNTIQLSSSAPRLVPATSNASVSSSPSGSTSMSSNVLHANSNASKTHSSTLFKFMSFRKRALCIRAHPSSRFGVILNPRILGSTTSNSSSTRDGVHHWDRLQSGRFNTRCAAAPLAILCRPVDQIRGPRARPAPFNWSHPFDSVNLGRMESPSWSVSC